MWRHIMKQPNPYLNHIIESAGKIVPLLQKLLKSDIIG